MSDDDMERRKDYINLQMQLSDIDKKAEVMITSISYITSNIAEFKGEHHMIRQEMKDRDARIGKLENSFTSCRMEHNIKDSTKSSINKNSRANAALVISVISVSVIIVRDFIAKIVTVLMGK